MPKKQSNAKQAAPEVTMLLKQTIEAMERLNPAARAIIDGDCIKFLFSNIVAETDVCALVQAGALVDAEFSDTVVDALEAAGVEYENWC